MRKTFLPLCLAAFASVLTAQITSYPYFINTVAGNYSLGDGGPATKALLESPRGIALDGSGNLYICDDGDLRVRRVAAGSGTITTLPGGTGHNCYFLATDAAGSVYFTDGIWQIYKLTTSGVLTSIAGGSAQAFGGDGGRATAAQLFWPWGIAIDSAGNIYFADNGNNRVREITTDGIIHTVAGTGVAGYNGDGIAATSANLNSPRGVAVDKAGNLYIADYSNQRVRIVTPDGKINTLAGTGVASFSGDGGPASKAALQFPTAVMVDPAGNLYISVIGRVREVTPDGNIQTIAGTGATTFGGDGGPATSAQIGPAGLALSSSGSLYIADNSNGRIRLVAANGVINTMAGATHFSGDGGPATSAVMHNPYGVAFDGSGNLYIADYTNARVRKVDHSGVMSTVAGTGNTSTTTPAGVATQVNMIPTDVATDGAGNVYIVDWQFCRIRRVTPDGNLTTVAGSGNCGDSGDGGPATAAAFQPWGVAVDAAGTLYISDNVHSRVRKVATDGTISTFAGTGRSAAGVDGVAATDSPLRSPYGLAVDKAGNVYIADYSDYRIRMVDPTGIITTVAGTGVLGSLLNDGKPANTVSIYFPMGVAVDGQGNLYFTEYGIGYLRKVNASGIISTITGFPAYGFSGDGGPASAAAISSSLRGIAVDLNGDVSFADTGNQRIRKLMVNSPVRLDITGGNNQNVPTGEYLPQPLTAQLVGRAAPGVPNVNVTFAVTAGSATLYPATAMTDPNGKAAVNLQVGSKAGPVTVSATVNGISPAAFGINAIDPNSAPAGAPVISSGGIVGAGLSNPAVQEVSANGIVTIFGSNFAPAGTQKTAGASDLVNGRLPVQLAGICVQVGAARAPVLAVSPQQINIQIPNNPLSKDAFVQVIENCGASNEIAGNMRSVMVRYATPEFFYFATNANGKNPVAATDAVTGELIGPGYRAAKPGDILTLYGTGFGPTSPPTDAGAIPAKLASVVLPVKVTIGAVNLAVSDILYAGISPGSPGLYQVNIRVPDTVPDGNQPVTLGLGLYSTPTGGYLTVKR
jgi:uncharacterized protein (TIGR03437 family)